MRAARWESSLDAPSISVAPIVQAQHHLDGADRFANIGYGSVFRLKPFRPDLAVGALSCAIKSDPTAHTRPSHPPPNSAQRGITPPSATDPAWGRSDWTFTSKLSAPPGAHYDRLRLLPAPDPLPGSTPEERR
jgi:hypothetical protein